MARRRLDRTLVERGLFSTRAKAQAAVMAGQVRVGGTVADKAGLQVAEDADIGVESSQDFVSRGGAKLERALDVLGVDVSGANAIDIGASTGGFTDCMLRRGAARVIAVDVGYGQLDWSLRNDERVTVMERCNARTLTADVLPFAPDFLTMDVAFIGSRVVWPAVRSCMADGWQALIMVKPQFELEPGAVGSGGVVRDPALRARAVRRVIDTITERGDGIAGIADSGLPGPKGNREIFVYALDGEGLTDEAIDAAIDAAIHEGVAA